MAHFRIDYIFTDLNYFTNSAIYNGTKILNIWVTHVCVCLCISFSLSNISFWATHICICLCVYFSFSLYNIDVYTCIMFLNFKLNS